MAKRLTDRQLHLEEARNRVELERRELRAIRGQAAAQSRRLKVAEAALAELSRCDWCGSGRLVLALGLDPQLCHSCGLERRRQQRVEFLAAHGYGPDGKRLPRAERAPA